MRWRWLFLFAGVVWEFVIVVVVFRYHSAHFYGQTLYVNDAVSSVSIVLVPLGRLVVGFIDLLVRTRRSLRGPGVAAMSVGGCVALFSLFGLLWGLVSVGVVGLLIVLTGQPLTASATNVPKAARDLQ